MCRSLQSKIEKKYFCERAVAKKNTKHNAAKAEAAEACRRRRKKHPVAHTSLSNDKELFFDEKRKKTSADCEQGMGSNALET